MAAGRRQDKQAFVKRSNLLDEQAEESDEDNGWGPVGGAEDEDEEGEGEDDAFLKGLVNDEVVDEEERTKQDELAAAKAR
jgi:mediator of replication checkpoint protein 1